MFLTQKSCFDHKYFVTDDNLFLYEFLMYIRNLFLDSLFHENKHEILKRMFEEHNVDPTFFCPQMAILMLCGEGKLKGLVAINMVSHYNSSYNTIGIQCWSSEWRIGVISSLIVAI